MDERELTNEARRLKSAAWKSEETGDLAGALREIETAIALRPLWSELWIVKGAFLRESRCFDDAKVALHKAVELDPSDHRAWGELGQVYEDEESYESAALSYRESVRLFPNFNMFTMLANVELAFDLEAALEHAECALLLNPSWDEAIAIRDRTKRILEERDRNHGV